MLSKKELHLLEFLLAKQATFVSSLDLAEHFGISDRTIRKYVGQLSASLEDSGASIVSKQGKGYCLTIEQPVRFEMFRQKQLQLKKQVLDLTQVEEVADRQRYILNKLLFEGPVQSFVELQGELFVGKTTLHSTLADIRKLISPYQLELRIAGKEVELCGDETAVRHFIKDYFFGKGKNDSLYGILENTVLPEVDVTDLMVIVLDECRDAHLKLSDFVMQNLVLHIALLLRRLKIGSVLEQFPIAGQIQSSKEYQVAQRIIRQIEDRFQLQIPTEEANYIALHLKVKLTGNQDWADQDVHEILGHVEACLQSLSDLLGLELYRDRQLCQGILAHLVPLLTRLEHSIQLANPLTEEIQRDYTDVLAWTKIAFSSLPELMGYTVTDDEWAYLALHVMAAIERYEGNRRTRVLVVCATGAGSALMLRDRLEKEFASSLEIVDVLSYYEVTEERLKDIDVIISSVNLSTAIFLTPVIHVSVFLSGKDIESIRSYLHHSSPMGAEPREVYQMEEERARQIAESVFSPKRILFIEEDLGREEVLEKMVSCLNEASEPNFVERFMEQVYLRESYSSVVFGETLAFPHPALPLSFSEQVVVGIFPNSVEWESDRQVEFVFLLSPSTGRNPYLKYISLCLVAFAED